MRKFRLVRPPSRSSLIASAGTALNPSMPRIAASTSSRSMFVLMPLASRFQPHIVGVIRRLGRDRGPAHLPEGLNLNLAAADQLYRQITVPDHLADRIAKISTGG